MNPIATHIPILLACLRHTSGPILEMGAGFFSTPLVNAFAVGRIARTIETDGPWYSTLAPICTQRPVYAHQHQFVFVPDYAQATVEDHFWSLVLIDHGPAERRKIDIERLRGRCQILIAHDSECDAYGYGPVLDKFKYRYTYSRLHPWTTVVSDTEPLDWLESALQPIW